MTVAWYLVVSALIFCVGAGGVLVRRNPLVILLCLELMLNAGNLALIGFSRMTGTADGQVFAIIVMVVAACEVVVGLGIIVAQEFERAVGEHHAEAEGGIRRILLEHADLGIGIPPSHEIGKVEPSRARAEDGDAHARSSRRKPQMV